MAHEVELAARHQAHDRQDDGDDDRPQPDGDALLGPVEAGHPPGHVATAEVGDQQDDGQDDRTRDAYGRG
ncbi:hypothetical protein ACFFX0_10005 [Citricoccus parietis]|uniref:Uncharacterized protein n=1 Tax=Citricoccus parietis TaxID=592307 RepID=A0ABV5FZ52_9MICC